MCLSSVPCCGTREKYQHRNLRGRPLLLSMIPKGSQVTGLQWSLPPILHQLCHFAISWLAKLVQARVYWVAGRIQQSHAEKQCFYEQCFSHVPNELKCMHVFKQALHYLICFSYLSVKNEKGGWFWFLILILKQLCAMTTGENTCDALYYTNKPTIQSVVLTDHLAISGKPSGVSRVWETLKT